MKRIITFTYAILLLAGFVTVSCSTNEPATMNVASFANNDFEDGLCSQVGIDHNLMIDQMFDDIFQQTPKSRSIVIDPGEPYDPIVPEDPIEPIILEYSLSDCIDLLTIPDDEKNQIKSTISQVCDDYLSGDIDTTAVFEPTNQYLIHESQLNAVMNDDDYDLTSLCSRINSIKESAKEIDDDIERRAILIGASIAENTLQYWHDNFDRICDSLSIILPLNSESDPIISPSSIHYPQTRGWLGFNWKSAGIHDLGAGLGAATSWFSRGCVALGPAGWKAAAVYIGVRAAVGSLTDLIYQYADNNGYSVSLIGELIDCNYDAINLDLISDYIVGGIVIVP